jgi:CRP/FNR family transcriptional regulator, anaerobic regulatory protein
MQQSRAYSDHLSNSAIAIRGSFGLKEVGASNLTATDIRMLSSGRCFTRKLEPGAALFDQGSHSDNVYILLEGWAFCFKVLEDGRRQILDLVLPGCILGFGITELMYYGVEAKTDCKLAVFNRQSFTTTLLKSPMLCLKCANLFAQAESRALERLSRAGRLSAVERVSGLIVELAMRLHAIGASGTGELKLMLTQAEIADMLGLAKETVCRALMVLRRTELVALEGKVLTILNLDGLLSAAGNDTEEIYDAHSTRIQGDPIQFAA